MPPPPSRSASASSSSSALADASRMEDAPLNGKALLAWAQKVSGVYPCSRLAHLSDGLVLLGLAQRLYPQCVRRDRITARHRGPAHASANWAALLDVMRTNGLPTCATDQERMGVNQDEGACLNSLVLFYFLFRLSRSESFTVDFAFAVEPRIAAFLQSPASLEAVGKRRRSALPGPCADGSGGEGEVRQVGVHEEPEGRGRSASRGRGQRGERDVRGRPVLPAPCATLSSVRVPIEVSTCHVDDEGPLPSGPAVATAARAGSSRVSAPSSSSASQLLPEDRYLRAMQSKGQRARSHASQPVAPTSFSALAELAATGSLGHRGPTPSSRTYGYSEGSPAERCRRDGQAGLGCSAGRGNASRDWTPPPLDTAAVDRRPTALPPTAVPAMTAAATAAAPPSADVHALRVENALLREELTHVAAMGRLALAQQRGRMEAELAQTAEAFAAAQTERELAHRHALRRHQLMAEADGEGHGEWRAVVGADDSDEVAFLHDRLVEAERRHADFIDRVLGALDAMAAVGVEVPALPSATPPSSRAAPGPASAEALAAQYESAVVDALVAQVRDLLPEAMVAAMTATLQSLVLSLAQVRASNARLRWEQAHPRELHSPGAHVDARRSHGGAYTRGGVEADGENGISHAGERDTGAVAQWESKLAAAQRTIATLKAALAESQQQQQQHPEKALPPTPHTQSATTAMEGDTAALSARWAARLRASEDRCAALALRARLVEEKALRDSRECATLYQRVASLIAHFCAMADAPSDASGADGRYNDVAAALTRALAEWNEGRGALDSMEAALQEQCETIAQLRRQLRTVRESSQSPPRAAVVTAAEPAAPPPPPPRTPSPRLHSTTHVSLKAGASPRTPSPPNEPAALVGLLSPEELERRKRAILAKYAPP